VKKVERTLFLFFSHKNKDQKKAK